MGEMRQRWLANVDEAHTHLFSVVGQGSESFTREELDLLSAAEVLLRRVQEMNGGWEGFHSRKGKAMP